MLKIIWESIKCVILLLALSEAYFDSSTSTRCLHKGCPLSTGLKVIDLNNTLNNYISTPYEKDNVIRVLQWNILYDKNDIEKDNWIYRKEDVCKYIKKVQPTIMGGQEVMKHQLFDLKSCLSGYSMIGSPRELGNKPQYNPIIYKKSNRLRSLDSGTFWLSNTPSQNYTTLPMSKESRICTWAKMQYKIKNRSGYDWKSFYFATTHLAWRSKALARDQVNVLMNYLKNDIMKGEDHPVILTGDFNSEDNTTVYEAILQKDWLRNTMDDSRGKFPYLTALPPYEGLVDYIWESKFISVLSTTLTDSRPNGRFLSDHRPVFAALVVMT